MVRWSGSGLELRIVKRTPGTKRSMLTETVWSKANFSDGQPKAAVGLEQYCRNDCVKSITVLKGDLRLKVEDAPVGVGQALR